VVHFGSGDHLIVLDPYLTPPFDDYYEESFTYNGNNYTALIRCTGSGGEDCELGWELLIVHSNGVYIFRADCCQCDCPPTECHWSFNRFVGGPPPEEIVDADS
jgi:hypothetical protein